MQAIVLLIQDFTIYQQTDATPNQGTPANAIKDGLSPVLQPVNIVHLNRITTVEPASKPELKVGVATTPGANRQFGPPKLVARLMQRRTSKAVASLMHILLTLAPADVPSDISKESNSVIHTVNGSEFSCPLVSTSNKNFKNVTGQLTQPKEANKIIAILKAQPDPLSTRTPTRTAYVSVRGVCLETPDDAVLLTSRSDGRPDSAKEAEEVLSSRLEPSKGIVNLITGMSLGTVLGVMAQTTGLFDALATCTGEMIENTTAHRQLIGLVPTDRVSIWKCT